MYFQYWQVVRLNEEEKNRDGSFLERATLTETFYHFILFSNKKNEWNLHNNCLFRSMCQICLAK